MFQVLTAIADLSDGTHAKGLGGEQWIVRHSIGIKGSKCLLTPDEGKAFLVCPKTADVHEVPVYHMLITELSRKEMFAELESYDPRLRDDVLPPTPMTIAIPDRPEATSE